MNSHVKEDSLVDTHTVAGVRWGPGPRPRCGERVVVVSRPVASATGPRSWDTDGLYTASAPDISR